MLGKNGIRLKSSIMKMKNLNLNVRLSLSFLTDSVIGSTELTQIKWFTPDDHCKSKKKKNNIRTH